MSIIEEHARRCRPARPSPVVARSADEERLAAEALTTTLRSRRLQQTRHAFRAREERLVCARRARSEAVAARRELQALQEEAARRSEHEAILAEARRLAVGEGHRSAESAADAHTERLAARRERAFALQAEVAARSVLGAAVLKKQRDDPKCRVSKRVREVVVREATAGREAAVKASLRRPPPQEPETPVEYDGGGIVDNLGLSMCDSARLATSAPVERHAMEARAAAAAATAALDAVERVAQGGNETAEAAALRAADRLRRAAAKAAEDAVKAQRRGKVAARKLASSRAAANVLRDIENHARRANALAKRHAAQRVAQSLDAAKAKAKLVRATKKDKKRLEEHLAELQRHAAAGERIVENAAAAAYWAAFHAEGQLPPVELPREDEPTPALPPVRVPVPPLNDDPVDDMSDEEPPPPDDKDDQSKPTARDDDKPLPPVASFADEDGDDEALPPPLPQEDEAALDEPQPPLHEEEPDAPPRVSSDDDSPAGSADDESLLIAPVEEDDDVHGPLLPQVPAELVTLDEEDERALALAEEELAPQVTLDDRDLTEPAEEDASVENTEASTRPTLLPDDEPLLESSCDEPRLLAVPEPYQASLTTESDIPVPVPLPDHEEEFRIDTPTGMTDDELPSPRLPAGVEDADKADRAASSSSSLGELLRSLRLEGQTEEVEHQSDDDVPEYLLRRSDDDDSVDATLAAAQRILENYTSPTSTEEEDDEDDGTLDEVLSRLDSLAASMRARSLRFEARGDLLVQSTQELRRLQALAEDGSTDSATLDDEDDEDDEAAVPSPSPARGGAPSASSSVSSFSFSSSMDAILERVAEELNESDEEDDEDPPEEEEEEVVADDDESATTLDAADVLASILQFS